MSETKQVSRESKEAALNRKAEEVIQEFLNKPNSKTADAVFYVTVERAEALKEQRAPTKGQHLARDSASGRITYGSKPRRGFFVTVTRKNEPKAG